MNYYERHLGDYARDTGHLSMLEHGAYTLLIDRYYATEKGIDADEAHRLARARTDDEKAAVDGVLREFFHLVDGLWHQKNCDEVIAAYRAGEPERLAKKSNEDTRMKRHRDERAALFARLNAAGHHAAWNISIVDLRTLVERTCNAPATQPATAPATPATATQAPSTNHQTPVGKASAPSTKSRGTRLPADWSPDDALIAWVEAEAPTFPLTAELAKFRDYWAAKAGAGGVKLDWSATFRNWVRNAHTGNAHANIQQGSKPSAVERVEQAIRDRRANDPGDDQDAALARIGYG